MRVALYGAEGQVGAILWPALAGAGHDVVDAREHGPSGCDAAVDFTTPDAVGKNVALCLEAGIPVVIGTTGFDLYATDLVELHSDAKRDAPSGTSKATATRMGTDPPIHSIRLPGLVAHQEVLFGGPGETLTIRHDTTSREAFVPGVLLALERVRELPHGLTVGLDELL
jgi:4-hydroxy-tetrahydrodipicolinate reductase